MVKRRTERVVITENIRLRNRFNKIRKNKEKLRELIVDFCHFYLVDDYFRPLIFTPMQEEIVLTILYDAPHRQQVKVVVLAPRGSGKSYAISAAAVIWLYFYRASEEVLLIAPHENQVVDALFNKICKFFTTSEKLRWLVDKENGGKIVTGTKPRLVVSGGSWVRPFAVNRQNKGESIRGQHGSLVVVDESPYIPIEIFQPNVEPVIRRKKAPFINIGTPLTEESHVYKYLYQPAYQNEFCRPLLFTYLDGLPDRKGNAYESAYTFEDMKHTKAQWGIESMKFRTEYLCEFIPAEGSYFPHGIAPNLEEYFLPARHKVENIAISVDVGRKDASTVIGAWEKMYTDEGVSFIKLIDIDEIIPGKFGQDFPTQRKKIMAMVTKHIAGTIIVDAKGLGIGMEDELRQEIRETDRRVRVVPVKFGTNKGQYFSFAKDIMQQNRVVFPDPDYMRKKRPLYAIRIDKMMRQFRLVLYTLAEDGITIKIKKPIGEHDDHVAMTVMAIGEILRREEQKPVVIATKREARQVFITKREDKIGRRSVKGRMVRKGAGFIG